MTVLLVGGVAWVGAHDLDPSKPIASTVKPVKVQVVSLDWKWLFIYPEQGIATVNQLTIPVGTPINFELTSSGVMNSFFVPQLGSQIYTMAGMATRLHLQADHRGSYPGLSANFSGDGFAEWPHNQGLSTIHRGGHRWLRLPALISPLRLRWPRHQRFDMNPGCPTLRFAGPKPTPFEGAGD